MFFCPLFPLESLMQVAVCACCCCSFILALDAAVGCCYSCCLDGCCSSCCCSYSTVPPHHTYFPSVLSLSDDIVLVSNCTQSIAVVIKIKSPFLSMLLSLLLLRLFLFRGHLGSRHESISSANSCS